MHTTFRCYGISVRALSLKFPTLTHRVLINLPHIVGYLNQQLGLFEFSIDLGKMRIIAQKGGQPSLYHFDTYFLSDLRMCSSSYPQKRIFG